FILFIHLFAYLFLYLFVLFVCLSGQLILDILHSDKYIPHFFDLERKKSSLTVAIKFRRTTIVAALINYCIEKASINNHPGWVQIVVPCLPKLCGSYPDLLQKII